VQDFRFARSRPNSGHSKIVASGQVRHFAPQKNSDPFRASVRRHGGSQMRAIASRDAMMMRAKSSGLDIDQFIFISIPLAAS
jgi:hypothetical protein